LLKPVAFLEHRAAARAEAALVTAVDAVVAISETDAQGLASLIAVYGEKKSARAPQLEAVPPVVESSEPTRTPPDAPRLCYVGSLTWHPNVLGLDWFCAQVLPELRRLLPAVTVRIAGSGLAKDASGQTVAPESWRVPNVEVVGFVPDLETLYADCGAMIAPIVGGSGVRIKLLEALRAGMPVVTTSAGAAGLPLKNRVEVLIEDDPDRFARAAKELLSDPGLAERLRRAGYRFLAAHHSPRVVATSMRRALGLPSS
jgi:glycosyltransferase involved in cell wall biosynthesis